MAMAAVRNERIKTKKTIKHKFFNQHRTFGDRNQWQRKEEEKKKKIIIYRQNIRSVYFCLSLRNIFFR